MAVTTNYRLLPTTCRAQRGMTLIDTVVGAALMLLVFMGVAAAFQLSIDVVTNNKARAGAIALGNERMEYIRSLTYGQIGTAGGIPAGSIAQSETVSQNGVAYTRRTVIEYADDPKDGLGASDQNGIPEDYKVARVSVSWTSRTGTRSVTLVTRIETQSGMETACTSPCGTLALSVVNAVNQPVSSAQVHVVNGGVSPSIDTTIFTDLNGSANLVGAPVATGYSVTVTKTGYNSDQTYTSGPGNTNPTPGPFTVSSNQTTSGTFRIDLLATKTIYTWTQVLPGTWSETMSDASKIASSTNVSVSGGLARLSGSPGSYPSYGELQSITISPTSVAKWKTLTLTDSKPAQTAITYHVYDSNGQVLIPDSQLPGNSSGLATSSATIDLSNISTSTYPGIRLDATLSSLDGANTPSIDAYSVAYDYGPLPLPNLALSMQGQKTIGSGPPPVYKYSANFDSGANAVVVLPNIEWDTYTLSTPATSGYDIASSCAPQPETLNPGDNAITYLYLAAHTANSLLVDVRSGGLLVQSAQVSLWKGGTATTTITTDRCGQAFFPDLLTVTYFMSVSTTTHPTYWNTNPGVPVSGTTRSSVTLN